MSKDMPRIIPEVCPLIDGDGNCFELAVTPDTYPCIAYIGDLDFTDPKDYIKCWMFSRWFWRKVTEGGKVRKPKKKRR